MDEDRIEQEHFRTRWRKWLGNKTAAGKPYWITLLDSRWSDWCQAVCRDHEISYKMDWTRESVKCMYRTCIDIATMRELIELDDIYAWQEVTRLEESGR